MAIVSLIKTNVRKQKFDHSEDHIASPAWFQDVNVSSPDVGIQHASLTLQSWMESCKTLTPKFIIL